MELTNDVKEALLKRIEESARTNHFRVHIVPSEGLWLVGKEKSDGYYRKMASLEDAVQLARSYKDTKLIVVHDNKGRVKEQIQVA